MKVNFIIALYYSQYYAKVRKEVFSLINKCDYNILFVDNNGSLIPGNEPVEKVFWLKGSNVAGEFSAWDEGYFFLKQKGLMSDNDVIVFMNDTFCHHRFFTLYDRILYRRAIKNCTHDGVYGELNSTGADFSVNDLPLNAWISSYTFLSRIENIDKLLPFNSASTISDGHFAQIESNLAQQKVNVPLFSKNLNQHLSDWLFPVNGSGWYKAGKISNAILLFKLKAIINEKLLTHKVLKNKLSVNDIYQGKLSRIYNSLRNRLYIFCKRYKR